MSKQRFQKKFYNQLKKSRLLLSSVHQAWGTLDMSMGYT